MGLSLKGIRVTGTNPTLGRTLSVVYDCNYLNIIQMICTTFLIAPGKLFMVCTEITHKPTINNIILPHIILCKYLKIYQVSK